jgi:putative transposase
MPHTHVNNVMHCVFSTKNREPLIAGGHEQDLWAYMGGIARSNRMKPICIGGIEDHVHVLIALPSDLDIAKAMQLIKGGSSKWFHEKHAPAFQWQQGFGAFSVSASLVSKTIAYIKNQRQHHRKMDFKQEYLLLLEKHGVDYDERYLW